ncbi:MAG: ribosome silencing factor, partial [Candidatus Hydrogenedentales bacterium]
IIQSGITCVERNRELLKTLNPALETLEGRLGRIASLIDENKGEQIAVLDLRGLCDFTDAFVIATARSRTHLHAIGHHLVDQLREEGLRPIVKPDTTSEHWVVVDFGDVIVHLFDAETRLYYDIENLWGDAESMDWPALA